MASEKPLRLAILGLSSTSSWATVAHLPYLLSPVGSSHFTIAAICNTSIASSQRAIAAHSLPPSTKSYGSPSDLASDPSIDVVLCSVNVALHFDLLKPIVEAGKDIYCEWPLCRNLRESEELGRLARDHGCGTVIGLQSRLAPVVRTIQALLASGRIGRVLSCNFTGPAGYCGPEEDVKQAYFHQEDVGGNLVSIFFGHAIETVLAALGTPEKNEEVVRFSSLVEKMLPTVDLVDRPAWDPERKTVRTVERECHDVIMLQGRVGTGALVSVHLYGGKVLSPDKGLHWRIVGEKGEIDVTAGGTMLQIGYGDEKVRVMDNRTGKVEEVELMEDECDEMLPLPSRNVARVWEAYRRGRGTYPDWEDGLRRHRLIEEIYKREREGRMDQKAEYLEE